MSVEFNVAVANDSRSADDERKVEDSVTLGNLVSVLRTSWWKILGPSLGIGLLTLLLMFLVPNYYRSRAIIAPSGDENKPAGALGALASFGLQLGGPTRIEDLEALLRSFDLTAKVFSSQDLWADIFGASYDPRTKALRPGIMSFLRGRSPQPLGDWDAIRNAENDLRTLINKKAGTLTISFDALSAEGSAKIVRLYIEEAKNRMQTEALEHARNNKKFLEDQVSTTPDALTRDRLYTLLGQEIEKEMMARNREQVGFKIIDSPRIPDRKAGPARALAAISAFLVSLTVLTFVYSRRQRNR